MRTLCVLLAVLLVAAPVIATHSDGKGARSLGGATVPRTDTWLTLEADEFPEKPVGELVQDAQATGGTAWSLTTYGMITTEIDVPETGVVWIDIRARGTHPPDMMNPHMHILIDGEQRAEWDVRGELIPYPQSVPLLAGKHTLSVDNFNNYRADVEDRVLIVDWVKLSEPTLEGSPRVPAPGHVVVDATDIHNSVTGQLSKTTEARNGTEWHQWGVGCFVEMVVFEGSGEVELDARLRGNVHDGVGSHTLVRVDGELVQEWDVGDERAQYQTRFTATAGPHVVEICYDNDEGGKKRNLWLDEMVFTSFATEPGDGTTTPAPSEVPAAPWPAAHGTLENHRHTASAIDRGSIQSARAEWRYEASGPVTGTVAYDDGAIYFGDFGGKVHAVDAKTGAALWSVDHGAGVDSSVALDDDNVYIGDMDGWLSARQRTDGSLVWRVKADEVDGTHLYGSPVVHDGVLYTGVASEQTLIEYEGPQTFRGSVAAFSTADGAMLWKTYTQSEDGLGVSVWSTPALDVERGLLFVGTGNSYGEPVGQYTDSILALKMADGAVAWHFQATQNDGFNARGGRGPDWDFGASPILFEAGGRALVGDGDKGGRFFALDRETGELLWNVKVDFKVDGVAPSQVEGFLGTAAYRDGVIYAPTTARSMVHAIDAATGDVLWGTEVNPLPRTYGDRMFGHATAAQDIVLQGNAFGNIFALDMTTGVILANLSAGGAVQAGITLAGDAFYVPDVGKSLWGASGGVTAFKVDAKLPPPTAGGTPSTPGPGDSPPTPTENLVEGNESGDIRDGIPGPGTAAVLLTIAAAGGAWSRRARRG